MSATTGYFVAGSSWLHHRNPLTKLLALALVLLSAFLLPPVVLIGLAVVIVAALWSAGLLRQAVRAMRIPALLLLSILLVNALFFPGRDVLRHVGPLSVTQEGLTFGCISAARLLVAFLASVAFLFTTLADDMLETLIARGASYRIAFVVLSAIQLVPRMRSRAGAILEAQQARGLSREGSFGRRIRSLVPLVAPVSDRWWTLGNGPSRWARGFGARPGRTAYRIVADPPIDRWLRILIVAVAVGVVLAALGVIGR
jgi:energy-coupling factor transport system permease protein